MGTSRQNEKLIAGLSFGMLFVFTLLVVVPSGKAIPAFSRKYQTSCTTGHNNYPELNDFGLAFKKNGFEFRSKFDIYGDSDPGGHNV